MPKKRFFFTSFAKKNFGVEKRNVGNRLKRVFPKFGGCTGQLWQENFAKTSRIFAKIRESLVFYLNLVDFSSNLRWKLRKKLKKSIFSKFFILVIFLKMFRNFVRDFHLDITYRRTRDLAHDIRSNSKSPGNKFLQNFTGWSLIKNSNFNAKGPNMSQILSERICPNTVLLFEFRISYSALRFIFEFALAEDFLAYFSDWFIK